MASWWPAARCRRAVAADHRPHLGATRSFGWRAPHPPQPSTQVNTSPRWPRAAPSWTALTSLGPRAGRRPAHRGSQRRLCTAACQRMAAAVGERKKHGGGRFWQHWRDFGLPAYAQFDNDTIFQGSHSRSRLPGPRYKDLLATWGRDSVFAPPREPGFQAAIENFNGRWQAKVWSRFHHNSLAGLQAQSRRYIRACHRQRAAARIDAAPKRRPFPSPWQPNLQAHPQGSSDLHTSHFRSSARSACLAMSLRLTHSGPIAWFGVDRTEQ